jgi:DNA-binding MarR family transcriptional regulator
MYVMTAMHRETAGELVHELNRHARLLHLLRSRMAGWGHAGLDGAAFSLLMTVVKYGPTRQGELAEVSLLDPSTVSRHVGQLVKAGLVSRRPDPADGRAVQIVTTEQGKAIGAQAAARREKLIEEMLADWSEQDMQMLVTLLRRLNDEMDARREIHGHTPTTDRTTGLNVT